MSNWSESALIISKYIKYTGVELNEMSSISLEQQQREGIACAEVVESSGAKLFSLSLSLSVSRAGNLYV